MSRYSYLSPLALAVFETIQPRNADRPISLGDIQRAHQAPGDAIRNAVAVLIDARLVSHMTHIVAGTATALYWPTGLKPIKPVVYTPPKAKPMPAKKPEPGSITLIRAIQKHGPISGNELAIKTNIAARNIDTVLTRAGAIFVTRTLFAADKGRGLKHYMTIEQAAEWDAREAAEKAASRPAAKAKQKAAEIPVNETDAPTTDPELLAMANRMLAEKLSHMEKKLKNMRTLLAVRAEKMAEMERRIDNLISEVAA